MSVSHTGTNFTKRLFIERGFEDLALNQSPTRKNAYYCGHIRPDDLQPLALKLAGRMPLICPFRHPYRTEASWLKQGRGTSKDLVAAYRILFEKYIPLKPYILAVDSPNREKQLSELSKGIGLDLKTDWEVINTKANTYATDLKDFNPSDEVIAFTKEINQFLGTYYGETRPNKRGRTRGSKQRHQTNREAKSSR